MQTGPYEHVFIYWKFGISLQIISINTHIPPPHTHTKQLRIFAMKLFDIGKSKKPRGIGYRHAKACAKNYMRIQELEHQLEQPSRYTHPCAIAPTRGTRTYHFSGAVFARVFVLLATCPTLGRWEPAAYFTSSHLFKGTK